MAMSSSTDRIVVSVHVPKTAGTTFKAMLQKCFGSALLLDYGDDLFGEEMRPKGLSGAVARAWRAAIARRALLPGKLDPKRHRCVHGHFFASKYDWLEDRAFLATWLRDPVERVVSHYYFFLNRPSRANPVRARIRELSLEQFAAEPPLRDVQSRILGGVPLERFGFVGLQSEFNAMVGSFFSSIGTTTPEIVSRNRTKRATHAVSEATREWIRRMNQKDLRLYDEARALVERRGWL